MRFQQNVVMSVELMRRHEHSARNSPYRSVSQTARFRRFERQDRAVFLLFSLCERIQSLQSHCRGQGFDSPQLHQPRSLKNKRKSGQTAAVDLADRKKLTFGVSYVDTNIDQAQALSVGATKDIVDSVIVVSLGASF